MVIFGTSLVRDMGPLLSNATNGGPVCCHPAPGGDLARMKELVSSIFCNSTHILLLPEKELETFLMHFIWPSILNVEYHWF